MKRLGNRKGFTLIELLVAISILGVIMVIALPQISNIQSQNQKTKYKKYAESMLTSAKLYTDSYTEDMFGYNISGCIEVGYSSLSNKDLLNDIKIDGSTCFFDDTYVRVTKANDHYFYDTSILCKDRNGNVVYRKTLSGNCGSDPDGEGPIITITPRESGWTKEINQKVTIKIWDTSGMSENTRIKISWTKNGQQYGRAVEHNFGNTKYEASNEEDALTWDEVPVPIDESGRFVLTVTPVAVTDSLGNSQTARVTSGEFLLDNTPPTKPQVNMYQWRMNSLKPSSALMLNPYNPGTWSSKKVYTYPSGSSDEHSNGIYYQYKIKGGRDKQQNKTANFYNAVENGRSIIQWRACDAAGNCSSYSNQQTIKIDMTAPTIESIENPTAGNATTEPFSLTLRGKDQANLSGINKWKYKYEDDDHWTDYADSASSSFVTPQFSEIMNKEISISVCDKAGNCSESSNSRIHIEEKIPCTEANPLGCPQKHTCRNTRTTIYDIYPTQYNRDHNRAKGGTVKNTDIIYVIDDSKDWVYVYIENGGKFNNKYYTEYGGQENYGYVRKNCIDDIGVTCPKKQCPTT